jgi:hypothetical protein
MAGYGYGMSVSGSRTPVVASITPAPGPTLPLSTLSLHISGAGAGSGAYLRNSDTFWLFDDTLISGNLYKLAFGLFIQTADAWELFVTDGADNDTLQSTNLASSSAIPLTGWSPSITITTP